MLAQINCDNCLNTLHISRWHACACLSLSIHVCVCVLIYAPSKCCVKQKSRENNETRSRGRACRWGRVDEARQVATSVCKRICVCECVCVRRDILFLWYLCPIYWFIRPHESELFYSSTASPVVCCHFVFGLPGVASAKGRLILYNWVIYTCHSIKKNYDSTRSTQTNIRVVFSLDSRCSVLVKKAQLRWLQATLAVFVVGFLFSSSSSSSSAIISSSPHILPACLACLCLCVCVCFRPLPCPQFVQGSSWRTDRLSAATSSSSSLPLSAMMEWKRCHCVCVCVCSLAWGSCASLSLSFFRLCAAALSTRCASSVCGGNFLRLDAGFSLKSFGVNFDESKRFLNNDTRPL